MKRYLLLFVLTLAMVLSMASATLASPVLPNEVGQWSINADLYTFSYYSFGAGYGVSDEWTIGAAYTMMGGADLYLIGQLGPVVLKGDLITNFSMVVADISAVYAFDLGATTLGLGGGIFLPPSGFYPYVKVIADFQLGDHFDLYGQLGYAYGGGPIVGAGCEYVF